MEQLQTTAPGKLVLIGEYAVLEGARAVVMAVNRRARVAAVPSRTGSWSVHAPGLTSRVARFELAGSAGVRWVSDLEGERLILVTQVLNALLRDGRCTLDLLPPMALELDSRAFFVTRDHGAGKLGLGSSAAVTVALAGALVAVDSGGHLPDRSPQWLQALVEMHRRLQGGRGSGIDVAASLHGGVVEFTRDPGSGAATAQARRLPEGLLMSFVWTGRSASTSGFLERLESRRAVARREVDAALRFLGDVSEEGAAAVVAADVDGFLRSVDSFWEGLAELGRALEMPILSDEHLEIRGLAEDCGVRYKPSGAGGGDLGIAVSDDAEGLREFQLRAAAAGYLSPDLAQDLDGLSLEGM